MATIIRDFLQKDKKRIRIGALMVAGAVMTCHHCLTNTRVETICFIYGALLLIVIYWLVKYYKSRENSISFYGKQDSKAFFEVESLLTGAGAGMIIPENSGLRFGGGSFGGSGSGGNY